MVKESKQKLNRMLSSKLYEIGLELHSTISDEEGNSVAINNLDALARSVWMYALGREEKLRDGQMKKHLPSQWAIGILFDRLEGKVMPTIAPDKSAGIVTAAEKVSELNKKRMNDLIDE